MKIFLKTGGIILGSFLIIIYLSFLFILPNVINLNNYENDIKNIVSEQTGLNISYENPKIQTTPLLSVWLKLDNIKISDENGVNIVELPNLKVRVSLPSIFLLTAKVSAIEADSPSINLLISDGAQLDVLRKVEEIVNNNKEKSKSEEKKKSFFDPSIIRIKIVNVKISNYKVNISDLVNKNELALEGENLSAGYFNNKNFKVKTNASVSLDKTKKIGANINLDCFIPKATELDSEDDPAENFELPPINPIKIYKKFNLEADVISDLKIRNKKHGLFIKGYLDIDSLSLKLSDFELPKSYIKAKFGGFKALLDTNIFIKENEKIALSGKVHYGKNPKTDLKILTDKIYFDDLIFLLKEALNTFEIKNDFQDLKGEGYILADTEIKTNFKNINSKGELTINDGRIISKSKGAELAKINADIIFDDKNLKIKSVTTNLGGKNLEAKGDISDASFANIKLDTNNLPINNLFNIFAPPSIKKSYTVEQGSIFMDFVIKGKLKEAILSGNCGIKDLNIQSKDKSIIVKNNNLKLDFEGNIKDFKAKFDNNNFSIFIPSTNSKVELNKITADITKENINILPFSARINSKSSIDFEGSLQNYMKNPTISFVGIGNLDTSDLKQFLGSVASPFISSQGSIPISLKYETEKNKGDFTFEAKSNSSNYITPLISEKLLGRPTILKAHVILKPNRLNIRETGLYLKEMKQNQKGEMEEVLEKVLEVTGTINNTDSNPFINIIKVEIPKNLKMSIVNFKDSNLLFGGHLKIFGASNSPSFKGEFNIDNLSLPDILSDIKNIKLLFNGKNLNISGSEIMINGSDMKFSGDVLLVPSDILNITKLDFLSVSMNLDRLLKSVDLLMKKIPQTPQPKGASKSSDIPVSVKNGTFNIHRASTGNITADSIRGQMSLERNILYISNLMLSVFKGIVQGSTNVDLSSLKVYLKLRGEGINTGIALEDAGNIKNAIYGTTSFETDMSLLGVSEFEDLIKSLDGNVKFSVKNGQFGGFAKFENFILAENIRESQFFQTALGGIISSLATIDTTHFEEVQGSVNFDKGILHLIPVTSKGNVITFNITGDMDILKNEIDMKLRGRLASAISNILGPLAAINPINIVKKTPGLNIVLAKTFTIFCESVTQEELSQIPVFNKEGTTENATNFQIVLRGNLNRPLTLVKSFKWLALQDDIDSASGYVSSLPEPEVDGKGNVLETPEEIEAYNAKTSTKIKKFFKKVFKK